MRTNASRDVVSRALRFMGSPFLPASRSPQPSLYTFRAVVPITPVRLWCQGKKCCAPRPPAPELASLQPLPPRDVHVGNSPRIPPDGPDRGRADAPGRPSGPLFSLTITSSPQYEPLPLYPRTR